MQIILRKRVLRDLKENLFRYLALGILILVSMYLIVSMLGAAETIIQGGEYFEKQQNVDTRYRHEIGKPFHLLVDLLGQFPGRRHDDTINRIFRMFTFR